MPALLGKSLFRPQIATISSVRWTSLKTNLKASRVAGGARTATNDSVGGQGHLAGNYSMWDRQRRAQLELT